VENLKKDLEDRDRQLNDALVRDGDAKGTINQLEQELAKLRAGARKGGEDWVTFNNFDMLSVPGSVLFESGRANLTPGGRSKIAQIASDIRGRFPNRDIYVFGHTDDQPIRKSKWQDNWELGAARALMVVRALRDAGIPDEFLVQANCGQHRPRASNAGDKGRSQNRRVEFYAVQRKGALTETPTAMKQGE
jgi:chemotaxis protein MotB